MFTLFSLTSSERANFDAKTGSSSIIVLIIFISSFLSLLSSEAKR